MKKEKVKRDKEVLKEFDKFKKKALLDNNKLKNRAELESWIDYVMKI